MCQLFNTKLDQKIKNREIDKISINDEMTNNDLLKAISFNEHYGTLVSSLNNSAVAPPRYINEPIFNFFCAN